MLLDLLGQSEKGILRFAGFIALFNEFYRKGIEEVRGGLKVQESCKLVLEREYLRMHG